MTNIKKVNNSKDYHVLFPGKFEPTVYQSYHYVGKWVLRWLHHTNSTIHCWILPKNETVINEFNSEGKSFFYFLVEKYSGKPFRRIYGGETSDFRKRMFQHINDDKPNSMVNFDYEIVCFYSIAYDGWNSNLIKYLESYHLVKLTELYSLERNVDNLEDYKLPYLITNDTVNRFPAYTNHDDNIYTKCIRELTEFRFLETAIDQCLFIYPFENVKEKPTIQIVSVKQIEHEFFTDTDNTTSIKCSPIIDIQHREYIPTWKTKTRKSSEVNATAFIKEGGVEIQIGSICNIEWTDKLKQQHPQLFKIQCDLIQDLTLQKTEDNKYFRFTKPYVFSSLGTAICFLHGTLLSGIKKHWNQIK
jgi:hypothetical protein